MATRDSILGRIAANSTIGVAGSAITAAALLVRTFWLGRHMELADFGQVVICINFFVVLNLILRPGTVETLYRFYPAFEESDSQDRLSSILWFGVYVGLVCAAAVLAIAWFGGGWIAASFYENPALAASVRVLGSVLAFVMLRDTGAAILRLHNKFHLAVLPSVAGNVVGVAGVVSLSWTCGYTVLGVVKWIAAGEALALALVIMFAVGVSKSQFRLKLGLLLLKPIRGMWGSLRASFVHTSLFGILQSGSDSGGTFLLGVLGTPEQMAVMGFARTISRPLRMLQASIGSAVVPEVTRLYPAKRYAALRKLLHRFVLAGSVALVLGLPLAYVVMEPVIRHLVRPEYLEAIPVFLVLLAAQALSLMCLPFFALALSMDKLKRWNVVVATRFIYLAALAACGISALGLAVVQLLGSVTVRIFHDWPLYRSLGRLTHEQEESA